MLDLVILEPPKGKLPEVGSQGSPTVRTGFVAHHFVSGPAGDVGPFYFIVSLVLI